MSKTAKQGIRTTTMALALAVGGALAGLSLAPRVASASEVEMAGYTCSGTDACHEGDRACCTDDFGGTGHCSTNCPINGT